MISNDIPKKSKEKPRSNLKELIKKDKQEYNKRNETHNTDHYDLLENTHDNDEHYIPDSHSHN